MFDADSHHGKFFDAHGDQLRVAGTQARLGLIVLIARLQFFGKTPYHYPAESPPVFVVMVENQRDAGILPHVGDPFQRRQGLSLGLLVDGKVHRIRRHQETNRYDVRMPGAIRGGQACDPLPV